MNIVVRSHVGKVIHCWMHNDSDRAIIRDWVGIYFDFTCTCLLWRNNTCARVCVLLSQRPFGCEARPAVRALGNRRTCGDKSATFTMIHFSWRNLLLYNLLEPFEKCWHHHQMQQLCTVSRLWEIIIVAGMYIKSPTFFKNWGWVTEHVRLGTDTIVSLF